MVDVKDIAKWFLSKEPMTHKKLQKLCYYSQAWYCTLYDGIPLYKDEIQAWVHGPVVASLYPVYSKYEWHVIPKASIDVTFDERVAGILEAVWEAYGEFTGEQLESLARSEAPWIEARGKLKPWEPCTNPITCESMTEYYSIELTRGVN